MADCKPTERHEEIQFRQLLEEAVTKPGTLMKAYSPFWNYSLGNHVLAVTGPDLDSVNKAFVNKHCNSCSERSPRPTDWTFSDEWQDGENERWADYIEHFRY